MSKPMTDTRRAILGRGALLLTALIWGSSFIIMKDMVDSLPVFQVLAIRFLSSCVLLGLIFFPRMRGLTGKTALHGSIMGVALFLAYAVQNFGLQETTPGKNAFLTAVYCVLVPFIDLLLMKKAPKGHNWIAAVICLAGIGLVSLSGSLTIARGDFLSLLCGLFFALHIVVTGHFSETDDTIQLTVCQFGAAGLCHLICALVTGTAFSPIPPETWPGMFYVVVFSTAIALLLQNVGQSMTPAAPAAILLSLESVFGVMFSVLLGAEQLTPRLTLGFALIFAAVVISEVGLPKFLRRKSAS
ncbi:MAG: DMT family transporter [Clostridia bacterium]|nr:DMT family transporter [Clostridia bacterium]